MLTLTETTPTTQPTSADSMDDAAILRKVEACDQLARADGRPFNGKFMWATITDPKHAAIIGDELIVLAAIASLTKNPAMGCRATHKALAVRASAIKRLFALANQVGWARLAAALGIEG